MYDNPNIGYLKINMGTNFISKLFLKFDYIVLDTDYDNYAIIYSHIKNLFMNEKMCWVMHRERILPPD